MIFTKGLIDFNSTKHQNPDPYSGPKLPAYLYLYCIRRPLFNRKLGADLGPFYQQSVEKKATNIISFAIRTRFHKTGFKI